MLVGAQHKEDDKMIKPGTMINVKKGLGLILLIMGAGFAFDIQQIQNLVMEYPIISIGSILASAYFLLISGRRR